MCLHSPLGILPRSGQIEVGSRHACSFCLIANAALSSPMETVVFNDLLSHSFWHLLLILVCRHLSWSCFKLTSRMSIVFKLEPPSLLLLCLPSSASSFFYLSSLIVLLQLQSVPPLHSHSLELLFSGRTLHMCSDGCVLVTIRHGEVLRTVLVPQNRHQARHTSLLPFRPSTQLEFCPHPRKLGTHWWFRSRPGLDIMVCFPGALLQIC